MLVISVDELLVIHDLVIAKTGGSEGLRDIGRLEAAIATQTQSVFGKELYPTKYHKAAALTRAIIGDHPFIDGNKRTGMLISIVFLRLNRARFSARKGEIEDFAVRVATERLSVEDIANWFKIHTRK